jgi:trimeric autotransporter adhesin
MSSSLRIDSSCNHILIRPLLPALRRQLFAGAGVLALGTAVALALATTPAQAVICQNAGTPAGNATADASDGGWPNNTGCGYQASAGGSGHNTAIGRAANAGGDNRASTAVGFNALATGVDSAAYGRDSRAAAANALALGTGLLNDGSGNNLAGATGEAAIAAGYHARAAADGATAVGQNARALALRSTAVGFASVALSNNSLALGRGAQARAVRSVAIGNGAIAREADTVSVGVPGSEKRIVNVADAVNATDAVNLGQVQAMLAAQSSIASAGTTSLRTTSAAVASTPSTATARSGSGSRPAPSAAALREDARSNLNNPAANDRARGAAAAPDAEELEPSSIVGWANLRRDGSVSRWRNVTGSVRYEAGEYEIAFSKSSLEDCTFNVNRSGHGSVSVEPGSLPNSIRIETRNHYGVLSDAAFYVMAVC